MAIPRLSDRIRTAIAAAAESLPRSAGSVAADRALPSPGDLYIFDAGEEVGIEWLVVRAHPDDPDLILLAPIDDFPLAGTPDLVLPADRVGRPMTVRCGETDWYPKTLFTPRLRVGTIADDVVALVKRRLADLARGRALTPEVPAADFDPEYEDQMAEVARARVALLARSERVPLASLHVVPLGTLDKAPPQPLACTPEFSMAAEAGGALFADLGQAIASRDDVRYHEMPEVPGGRLFLVIDPAGVRGIWEGPHGSAPALTSSSESGEMLSTSWRPGPEGRLYLTDRAFPWVDGRVALLIGTDPPRAMAVEI
jgi:hypothetical protein